MTFELLALITIAGLAGPLLADDGAFAEQAQALAAVELPDLCRRR